MRRADKFDIKRGHYPRLLDIILPDSVRLVKIRYCYTNFVATSPCTAIGRAGGKLATIGAYGNGWQIFSTFSDKKGRWRHSCVCVCVCVCVALAEHVSRGPLTAATRRSHYGSTKHQSASVFRIYESGCDTSSTATRWISNCFYFLVRMNDAVPTPP